MQWFTVNKDGLGKLLAARGPEFIGRELVQNALDENTTECTVSIIWEGGVTHIKVTDDSPEGFHDLSHAWTLFAESKKKVDPTKRGRFNLGEKLVLALCHKARITTTTGRVMFGPEGRKRTNTKTEGGSIFEGWIRQTKKNANAMREGVLTIIPPENIKLIVDGERVERPELVKTFAVKSLQTEYAGEDGILKKTSRNSHISLFATREDEPAYLHEMGIPVVELEEGDLWHVDVAQKIPLTLDRDNVTPAYMRRIRLLILNETHELLEEEDANSGWAREALKSPDATDEAVVKMLDLRFGKKRVAFDPSDPEANSLAISKGYTVIHGRQLSKEEWTNARRTESVKPAGQVTPSPKILTSMDGEDFTYPEENWTDEMRWVVEHTVRISEALIGGRVAVDIVKHPDGAYLACFGSRVMRYNLSKLHRGWFASRAQEGPLSSRMNKLIIHELGHHFSSNHLDSEYHEGLCTLGAKLAALAATRPELFAEIETEVSA